MRFAANIGSQAIRSGISSVIYGGSFFNGFKQGLKNGVINAAVSAGFAYAGDSAGIDMENDGFGKYAVDAVSSGVSAELTGGDWEMAVFTSLVQSYSPEQRDFAGLARQKIGDFFSDVFSNKGPPKKISNASPKEDEESVTIRVLVEEPGAKEGSGPSSIINALGLSGHSAMFIGDELYDYGPETGVGLSNLYRDEGAPWWDRRMKTSKQKEIMKEVYGEEIFNEFSKSEEGLLKMYTGMYGKNVRVHKFNVTKEAASKMTDYWDKLYKDPGTYTLTGTQCTTACVNALHAGGVNIPKFLRPTSFNEYLESSSGVESSNY